MIPFMKNETLRNKMSSITFDPPAGRIAYVDIPSESVRPTVLLFTARLNRDDHDQLVEKGGRVQLWTDFPDEGRTGSGWRPLDFVESPSVGVHARIALQPEPTAGREKAKFLYLMVCSSERIQFTYRVAYPSGSVVWLGDYEQNGLIIPKETEPLPTVDGLDITAGWTFNESRQAYVTEVVHVESHGVLKLSGQADFRVLALTEQGLRPNLENARLLFFVPRTQPSISIRPTYVLSCSPGLSMTVSPGGCILASGSGSMMLAVHDFQRDPSHFIQDHIQNSGLNAWNVFPCNDRLPSVALIFGGPNYAGEAAVIPLWPSNHLRIFQAPLTKTFETIWNDRFAEWAILSPSNSKIYLLNHGRETDSNQDIILRFDHGHNQFKFGPLYQFRVFERPTKKGSTWKAVVFGPHNLIQEPVANGDNDPLPTPPPSPLFRPFAHLTGSRASANRATSSTLESDSGTLTDSGSSESHDDKLQNPPFGLRRASFQTQYFLSFLWPFLPLARTFIVTPVKLYISTLTALMKCFIFLWVFPLRQIWRRSRRRVGGGRATPAESSGTNQSPEAVDTSPQIQAHDNLYDPDRIPSTPVVEADIPLSEKPYETSENANSSDEMLFIELYCDLGAIDPKNTTAVIALFIPSHNGVSTEGVAGSNSVNAYIASRAVRFVKGFSVSESRTRPECSISRFEIINRHHGSPHEQDKLGTCYLLSYNLVWDEGQNGKIICLSSPRL